MYRGYDGTNSTALSPDGAFGFDAWTIVDDNSPGAGEGGYRHPVTEAQRNAADANGWVLKARVRIPENDVPDGDSRMIG